MADCVVQCVLLLMWISLSDALRGLTPNTYMMGRLCGKTIDMHDDGIMAGKLRMTQEVNDCWVTARAPEGLLLMVSLVQMDFEEEKSCTDYVLLVDGASNSSEVSAMDVSTPMCSMETAKKYTVTKDRELTVRYHSEDVTRPGQFELLFTAVYEGPCIGSDYKCKSGYCINDELRCNGHNMCGNHDGCPKKEVDNGRDFRFWLAVAGGVGFLSFVAIYYIRQRRQRQQMAQSTADPQSLPLNSLQQPSQNAAVEPTLPPAYNTQYSTPGAYPPPVSTFPAPPSYSDVEKPPL